MNSNSDVVVIGSGVIGLTSAYFLQRAGFRVHVVDRREGPGLETSFANGGLLTPSMPEPWNAPGIQWDLLRYLGRKDAPMLIRPSALHHYIGWGLKFLAHSSRSRHQSAIDANFDLAALSILEMRKLRAECSLRYALGTKGTMKVFRNAKAFLASRDNAERLRDRGLALQVLDPAGIAQVEPLLSGIQDRLVGGIHYPDDETGDAHVFCRELHRVLVERGVAFSFGTIARRIRAAHGRVNVIETDTSELHVERIIVAAASWSPALLAPLGVKLHVRPVKGYSLSLRLKSGAINLSLPVVDDALHAAATPLGESLRLAGTAEFGGWNRTLHPGRLQNLRNFLGALGSSVNDVVDKTRGAPWCGFRPMSADGRPYIGATSIKGLYVNTGHGHLGWTQAAGSGRLLTDLLTGREPAIDPRPYRGDR